MFPTLPESLSELSDEELAALLNELVTAFNEATADAESLSEEEIAQLSTVTEDIETLRSEEEARFAASEARAAQVAELATRVNAAQGGDNENHENLEEGEGENGTEGEGTEGGQSTGTEGTQSEEGQNDEGGASAGNDNVQAGGAPTIGQLQRHTPARTRPRPQDPRAGAPFITAAGAGQRLDNLRQVAERLLETRRNIGPSEYGDRVTVAQFHNNVGPERTFSSNERPESIMARLAQFDTSPDGIQAAGGLCAPVNNYYEQNVISEAGRPVRDALARFNADRGGIKFVPAPTLADLASSAGHGIVTEANDKANTSNTKGYFTVSCADAQEVHIDAIYSQLDFGNFEARTFPERVQAWTELSLARHDQIAETKLLDSLTAGSTPVTAAGLVGAGREIFARLGQAAAGYRSRHRMRPDAPMSVLLPAWTLALISADFARTLSDIPMNIELSSAEIEALFRTKGLIVSWYWDSKTGGGQVFGAADSGRSVTDGATNSNTTVTSATAAFTSADVGKSISGTGIPAGTTISAVTNGTTVTISAAATATATGVTLRIGAHVLAEFPSTVYAYMFPAGTWLFLDGGELDLGLVRDNTSNATNRFRTFTETFEASARVGTDSYEIALDLTPDGSYGAAKTITRPILT